MPSVPQVLQIPWVPDDDPRMRRFTQVVSDAINSLFANGTLTQAGPGAFNMTGQVLFGSGPPAAGLGTAPCVYFDIAHPYDIQFYYKT